MNFDISRAIEVLTATPATLRSMLGGLSGEWTSPTGDFGLRIPDSAGYMSDDPDSKVRNPESEIRNRAWSPYDVVGHLIHGEKTDWIPRARLILEQGENRTFVPFDRFAQFEKSKGKSLVQLLDEFAKLRTENIDTLRSWNLDEAQLDLEGMHPELGPVTLRQLLATWVVHDLNHVRQIVTSMAGKYAEEVGVWKEYLSILES